LRRPFLDDHCGICVRSYGQVRQSSSALAVVGQIWNLVTGDEGSEEDLRWGA
jgi:hypothetical protein